MAQIMFSWGDGDNERDKKNVRSVTDCLGVVVNNLKGHL
jgi:hypothetical protein